MSGTTPDDEAWQAIVANYGERPEVEDTPAEEAAQEAPPAAYRPTVEDLDAQEPADATEYDRFVPPVPPPGPGFDPRQHWPWLGVFGSPAVLLVSLLAGISLPTWLGYLLVTGFVGSFVYLVVTMNRAGRDPFDDGARL